jgi:hypothetical protein
MRKAVVLALICAGALAGCNKQQEQMGLTNWEKAPPLLAGVDEGANAPGAEFATNGGAQAGFAGRGPAGGVAPASAPPAAPGTVPVRKPGLWQVTTNDGRGPARTSQICVTAETELRRGPLATGGRGPGCTPKISKGANGAWTSSMSCTRSFGENTIKTSQTETLTGDLQASYKVSGRSTTEGGGRPEMNGTRNISITGTYKGACPAGMKGGDMIGSDGQRRNVFEGGGAGEGRRGPRGGGGQEPA